MKLAAWTPSALACAALSVMTAGFDLWLEQSTLAFASDPLGYVLAVLTTHLVVVGGSAIVLGMVAAPVGSVASWAFWKLTRHRLAIAASGAVAGLALYHPVAIRHLATSTFEPFPFALALAVGIGASYALSRADFLLTSDWTLSQRGAAVAAFVGVVVGLGFIVDRNARWRDFALDRARLPGRVLTSIAEGRAKSPFVAPNFESLPVLVQGSEKLANKPNIILVTLDATAASDVPTSMPRLEKLGQRGTLFSSAYASSSVCEASLASIVTGAHAFRHGVFSSQDRTKSQTLFERLSETHDLTFFQLGPDAPPDALLKAFGSSKIRLKSDDLAKSFEPMVERRARPLAVWIHMSEARSLGTTKGPKRSGKPPRPLPHFGFPAAWLETLGAADATLVEDVRNGALGAQDQALGTLVDLLVSKNKFADTFLVVVGDHGFATGRRGTFGLNLGVHEDEIRVPVVFAGTGVLPSVSSTLFPLTDVAPTILEAAGTVPETDTDGRSVLPLLRGGAVMPYEAVPSFAAYRGPDLFSQTSSNAVARAALVTKTHKLVVGVGGAHVFDLARDPDEVAELLGPRAAKLGALFEKLQAWPGSRRDAWERSKVSAVVSR